MKVLITGGFGYLGGRLAQFLAPLPSYEVVLGSRKNTDSPHWLPNVKVIKMEWASTENLKDACAGVDAIVHMAGMNAQDCANNPTVAIEFNTVATSNLIQAAISTGVKRFIYLSTAHVYGSPLAGEITEETCPTSLHPYATSRKAAEDIVRSAFSDNKIESVIIRLSNAFGAPVDRKVNCWMLLINDLCHQAATSRQMVLRTTGLQRRDFITITDTCRTIDHLLKLSTDKLDNGVFNVGGGWSPTIKEITELVAERFYILRGYKPEAEYTSNTSAEISGELNFKISKLINTGFTVSPKKLINEELDKLIQFCTNEKVNTK